MLVGGCSGTIDAALAAAPGNPLATDGSTVGAGRQDLGTINTVGSFCVPGFAALAIGFNDCLISTPSFLAPASSSPVCFITKAR